jgi:hypothetical protein
MSARPARSGALGLAFGWLRPVLVATVAAAVVLALVSGVAGCKPGTSETTEETSATIGSDTGGSDTTLAPSGDIEGTIGDSIKVGKAVIVVRVLDATFNPVTPEQRMSEQTPSAPGGNESFYQAYVKIENKGVTPLRVDPEDFACAVGNSVVGIEATWSGPPARSLLKNSSLDLLVTFKAKAGYQPVLLFSPSWYSGTIRIKAVTTTTTTAG